MQPGIRHPAMLESALKGPRIVAAVLKFLRQTVQRVLTVCDGTERTSFDAAVRRDSLIVAGASAGSDRRSLRRFSLLYGARPNKAADTHIPFRGKDFQDYLRGANCETFRSVWGSN